MSSEKLKQHTCHAAEMLILSYMAWLAIVEVPWVPHLKLSREQQSPSADMLHRLIGDRDNQISGFNSFC